MRNVFLFALMAVIVSGISFSATFFLFGPRPAADSPQHVSTSENVWGAEIIDYKNECLDELAGDNPEERSAFAILCLESAIKFQAIEAVIEGKVQ